MEGAIRRISTTRLVERHPRGAAVQGDALPRFNDEISPPDMGDLRLPWEGGARCGLPYRREES